MVIRSLARQLLIRLHLWDRIAAARHARRPRPLKPLSREEAEQRQIDQIARAWQDAFDVPEMAGHLTTHEALAAFFESFRVVDPGIPMIRLGGDGDGGYLLPDDLEGVRCCLSPGVSTVATFESELVGRGIACQLVDASVPAAPIDHPLVTFRPLFLGGRDGDGWLTLERWVSELDPEDNELLLQMDIEGHEWAALLATPRAAMSRFRVIVIELHELQLLATTLGYSIITSVFGRLLEDFELVHVHANNNMAPVPFRGFRIHPVVETTWLRRDRVLSATPVEALLHSLDRTCRPESPEIPLDPHWA